MKYFTLNELVRSDKARQLKIDNTPTPGIVDNLNKLVTYVLDPLREAWGGPINVTSGYRCPVLNKAVGGAKTSHHMQGMAADIRIYARDSEGRYIKDSHGGLIVDRTANRKLFDLVLRLNLPFTQLIDESNFSWVHISYDPNNLKREIKRL